MNQETERKMNIVVEYFMTHPDAYIGEISEQTGIPKSSVQRYLERVKDKTISKTGLTIEEQLKINKLRGHRKGGITSFENNDSVKDSSGKFIGSIKTQSQDKELQKQKDILVIATYYLYRGQISLQDLTDELSEMDLCGTYTKDYVYDCLTDQRLSGLIGQANANEIAKRLKESRPVNIESESAKQIR